jgi:hypothetical protein
MSNLSCPSYLFCSYYCVTVNVNCDLMLCYIKRICCDSAVDIVFQFRLFIFFVRKGVPFYAHHSILMDVSQIEFSSFFFFIPWYVMDQSNSQQGSSHIFAPF